jgi:hypothetical protein
MNSDKEPVGAAKLLVGEEKFKIHDQIPGLNYLGNDRRDINLEEEGDSLYSRLPGLKKFTNHNF